MERPVLTFGHLMIYLGLVGGLPTLSVVAMLEAGWLLALLTHSGIFFFTAILLSIPMSVAFGMKAQDFFLKRYPQYK